MLFRTLDIKNFRSIDNEGIVINFASQRNLYSLIGANNSGKSNILDAIALVLGVKSGKFYNSDMVRKDFYNHDTSVEMSIKLTFQSPIDYRNVYQQICKVDGFFYRAKEYARGNEKGILHSDHYCFGTNAKGKSEYPLMDFEKMYKKPTKDEDSDIKNRPRPVLPREVMAEIGKVYYLAIEYLDSYLKPTGYSPLGRLFEQYRSDFNSEKSLYTYEIGNDKKEMTTRQAFDAANLRVTDILRTAKLKEIETSLSANISKFLGFTDSKKTTINLGMPSSDEMFNRLVNLKVKESDRLTEMNLQDLGRGYLSLFRLATISALADVADIQPGVYLIEEPELYLHPHLRRFFFRRLNELADKGQNIIFATHSSEFVDIGSYQSVVRVRKEGECSTRVYQVSPDTTLNFDRISQKVKRKGNDELFFSNFVILTEGQDDKIVLEEILHKQGTDCDAASISVIDCDSKSQIPDYIRLCSALNIASFAIFDTDVGDKSSEQSSLEIAAAYVNNSSRFYAFSDTLESALKTNKAKKDNWRHLLQVIDDFSFEDFNREFPDFKEAVAALFRCYESMVLGKKT